MFILEFHSSPTSIVSAGTQTGLSPQLRGPTSLMLRGAFSVRVQGRWLDWCVFNAKHLKFLGLFCLIRASHIILISFLTGESIVAAWLSAPIMPFASWSQMILSPSYIRDRATLRAGVVAYSPNYLRTRYFHTSRLPCYSPTNRVPSCLRIRTRF